MSTSPNFFSRLRTALVPAKVSSWAARRSRYTTQFIECASWEQAVGDSTGYTNSEILDRVDAATRAVISGEVLFELDGVLFHESEYRTPVADALLAAQSRDGYLRVIDFGGALGSLFWQHRPLLAPFDPTWAIVEQDNFVMRGRELPTTDVSFHHDLDAALELVQPNVILLSSVLQYLPDPLEIVRKLGQISEVGRADVVIDRTPMHVGECNIPTVQKVPEHIYRGSYAAWIISRSELEACFPSSHSLTWFPGIEPAGLTRQGTPFEWMGLLTSGSMP
jgi:putative methyltransferase (TIGR04325 family)